MNIFIHSRVLHWITVRNSDPAVGSRFKIVSHGGIIVEDRDPVLIGSARHANPVRDTLHPLSFRHYHRLKTDATSVARSLQFLRATSTLQKSAQGNSAEQFS